MSLYVTLYPQQCSSCRFPSHILVTEGDRAFEITAPRSWNSIQLNSNLLFKPWKSLRFPSFAKMSRRTKNMRSWNTSKEQLPVRTTAHWGEVFWDHCLKSMRMTLISKNSLSSLKSCPYYPCQFVGGWWMVFHKTWLEDGSQTTIDPINFCVDLDKGTDPGSFFSIL